MKIKLPSTRGIIKNNEIVEIKSFKCAKNTKFQAASISKVLTSLLVLRLVEKKKLSLKKDVNSYLKSFKVRDKKGKLVKVTLKQLLSHTAGINVSGFPGYNFSSKIPSINQILDGKKPCNTDKIIVESRPGKKYSYSGGGYMIIQKIIEDTLNKKYRDVVRDRILKPLKMKNSNFNLKKVRKFRRYPEKAAAGLWTTAEDLCKLLIEIQLSLVGKSNKIISKKLSKLMIMPVTKAENKFMGLGVFIKKNKKGFLHTGHNHKVRSKIEGTVHEGDGIVILINSDKIDDLKNIERLK